MQAAAHGHSNIGIPESIGKKFANSDPGGKLPEKAKDMSGTDWNSVFTGLMKLVKFFKEEQQEPEHQTVSGGEPLNEREQPGLDAPSSAPSARPAAGVAFITPRGDALFVRRVKSADHGGSWAFPGGWSEERERPHETAAREAKEEVGDDCTLDKLELADSRVADGVEYHTFRQSTPKRFTPRLNDEATEHHWASLSAPPAPLHPGVKATLDKWREDESEDELSSAGALAAHHVLKARGLDEPEETKKRHEGELSETTREKIGTVGSEQREDMPDDVFLQPQGKKYPVKEKRDGEWKYTRGLLLAAARRARMNHEEEIAKRADEIREREFGSKEESKDELSSAGALTAHHVLKARGLDGELAHDSASVITYDRSSDRWIDSDGRLHIDIANICEGKIDEYKGSEVNQVMEEEPGWQPLDDNKIYKLFRDPDELAKPETVRSANGIPILSVHTPTSAADHKFNETIGSTGTNARFEYPFIKNGITFWPQKAIDDIDDGSKSQLSPGYSYKADPTPGVWEGKNYDLRMCNIRFNHLAQVQRGRQGPRVVVPDAYPDWRAWAVVERAILDL